MKTSADLRAKLGRLAAGMMILVMVTLVWLPETAAGLPPHVPGRLLVKFRPAAGQRAITSFLARHQVSGVKTYPRAAIARVDLAPGTDLAAAAAMLEKDPAVQYAEPDYLLRSQQVPDDPEFELQWYLRNTGQLVNGYVGQPGADIKAVPAWEKADDSREIVVAVIDSGVDLDHPDLAAGLWTNPDEIPANGIDDDGNGKIDDVYGWDFVDNDNLPQDATGHGSHVAGIIAAGIDNGLGIAGVASNVRIMALRFINGYDLGSTSDAIAAIEYAVTKGARIINCSWGGPYYSRALHDTMAGADALFVCAAGNNSADLDTTPFYPAGYGGDNLVAVAATTALDKLAWFSNHGSESVDLAAPGFNIFSVRPGRSVIWQENFSDRDLDGWQSGGNPETWSVTGPDSDIGLAGVLALSPAGDYQPGSDTWIATPALDLGGAAASMLTFNLIGASQSGRDLLYIEGTTDGMTWLPLRVKIGSGDPAGSVSGNLPYWMPAAVDLGRFDGASFFRLRFRFVSDAESQAKGWYLDNLAIRAASATWSGYCYMHGTSMAAAVVSGAAAMAAGRNPALTASELKLLLTSSVDHLESLGGLVACEGRLNVNTVVYLAESVVLDSWPASERQIDLSWIINTEVAGDLTVERRSKDEDDFVAIATVPPDAGTFMDTGLTPGTTYIYRLRTLTRDGNPTVSNQAVATTPRPAGSGGGGGCFISILRSPTMMPSASKVAHPEARRSGR